MLARASVGFPSENVARVIMEELAEIIDDCSFTMSKHPKSPYWYIFMTDEEGYTEEMDGEFFDMSKTYRRKYLNLNWK